MGAGYFEYTPVVLWLLLVLSVVWVPALFHASKHLSLDRFLGDMSYAVYVLHYPFLMYAYKIVAGPWIFLWIFLNYSLSCVWVFFNLN